MARFLHHIDSLTFRKYSRWLLAFSWLLGLGAGGLCFRYAGDSAVSVMLLAPEAQLSIVSLFLCTLLPFLFSAFAVYLRRPRLLILICFCRAFLYAYVLCALFSAFPASGWLLRWLLLFTDSCAAALLFGFCLHHISGYYGFSATGFGLCTVCIGLAAGLDYAVISPFLRQLLS